jgi:short-subunit dehydrogenase
LELDLMSQDYKSIYGGWALVIGASEGLGEAMARDLAQRGMNVAMVARGEAKLRGAADRVASAFGVETLPIAADLADPNVLDVIRGGLGGREIGFLIYNCAAEFGGEFLDQALDRHLTNIQVNCVAPTVVLHHFAGEMTQRGRGGIVAVSSLAGVQGLYAWVTYGASKAYEMILGEGLWYELQHQGVNATAFMVGSTYTPNFQRNQVERNTLFAKSRTPDDLPSGIEPPQDPVDASAHLFAQIDREWLPQIYANPNDAEAALRYAALPRADRIRMMSDPMRRSWKGEEPGLA